MAPEYWADLLRSWDTLKLSVFYRMEDENKTGISGIIFLMVSVASVSCAVLFFCQLLGKI